MRSRSFRAQGIVLGRRKYRETDRILYLLTQEFGKMTSVAKGVRKLTSSKRALLEPGNYVEGFFIKTKGMPLLTQAKRLDTQEPPQTLSEVRALSQLLEIFDRLFVEQELEPKVFAHVLHLRSLLLTQTQNPKIIRHELGSLITSLGFQHPKDSKYESIADYVSALTDRPFRSFEFLQVK